MAKVKNKEEERLIIEHINRATLQMHRMEELDRLDPVNSIAATEACALSELLTPIRNLVDAEKMRLMTALRLMTTILDLCGECIAEREGQLSNPRKN